MFAYDNSIHFHSQHHVVFEVTVAPYIILVTEMSALLTRVSDGGLRITTVLHLESSEGLEPFSCDSVYILRAVNKVNDNTLQV
jgi:hypothetical protein